MSFISSEHIIRDILGPIRPDTRPLSYSIDIVIDMLFVQNTSIDNIRITKDVYPLVARKLRKSTNAVSRSAERLANRIWGALDTEQILKYIGRPLYDISSPCDIIFYLAYYTYHGKPYYKVYEERLQSKGTKSTYYL